jgi:hypothetical protein
MSRYSNPETGFDGMAHTVINSVLGQLGRPDGVPKDLWDAKNDDRTRRAATLLATLRSWRQRGLVISLTEPEQEYVKEQIDLPVRKRLTSSGPKRLKISITSKRWTACPPPSHCGGWTM